MACKLFTRPYCGKQLSWWVLQDDCNANKAPDIVFQEDPSFSPLTSSSSSGQDGDSLQQQFLHLMRSWSSSSSLDAVIGVLLPLYAQHNKERIAAAVTDERILFELSMLDELGCTEVLLTGDLAESIGPESYSVVGRDPVCHCCTHTQCVVADRQAAAGFRRSWALQQQPGHASFRLPAGSCRRW